MNDFELFAEKAENMKYHDGVQLEQLLRSKERRKELIKGRCHTDALFGTAMQVARSVLQTPMQTIDQDELHEVALLILTRHLIFDKN